MSPPYMLYGGVFLGSAAATLLLVPLFRWLALKLDVVDRPTEARKVHTRVVPYLGGVPFYIVFLGLVLVLEAWYPQHTRPVAYLMAIVGTLIVLMGLFDDIMNLSSLKKLLIETALMGFLFYWGVGTSEIALPLGITLDAYWLAIVVTPLWIVGVINAVNFTDGLDGLAGGLVCICAVSIFAVAFQGNQVFTCIIMAYLAGTTLGFLKYNFNPASVFMGDAGALFLGFVLGTATLVQNQKGVAVIALTVPMVVLAVPIVDTVLSFYRRLRRARQGAFFEADRDHLHHRLLDLGLSQRQVVLSLYYVSACMGLMAFILSGVPEAYRYLVLLLAVMAVGFGVIVLRFIEGLGRRTVHGTEEGGPDS